ncbi:MAG: hypothetical protein AAFQ63_08670 [Cyanobacteria bacterium J06621_11]
MKFFTRLSATLAIAAAALLSASSGAFAQEVPSYNYVGIGGSEDGFLVNGKLSVADNISIRPSIATDFDFDDDEDVSYLVPITYDFNTIGNGRTAFNPFIGAGVSGDIGDDSDVEFSLVAGTDYRFAQNYVVNGAVNYSPFADEDEVGFTAGIGYLF